MAVQWRKHRRADAAWRCGVVDDRCCRHRLFHHDRAAFVGGRSNGTTPVAKLHARSQQPANPWGLFGHVFLCGGGLARGSRSQRWRVRPTFGLERRSCTVTRLRRRVGVFRRSHGGPHQRRHRGQSRERRHAFGLRALDQRSAANPVAAGRASELGCSNIGQTVRLSGAADRALDGGELPLRFCAIVGGYPMQSRLTLPT